MKLLPTFILLLTALSCATATVQRPDFRAILASPERPDTEKALDLQRKPDEVLAFFGVRPGWKVADLMTGRGYYTAILSQVVGEKGMVYSASPAFRPEVVERFKKPALSNVKLLEGRMGNVGLPQDGSLDFAIINLNYHDLDIADRTAMNKRVFGALKPGGTYAIIDHAAKDGSGNEAARTLHRIDKALVLKEAGEAGFILSHEGEMLRNPGDARTGSSLRDDRGKTDRFVLELKRSK